MTKGRPHTSPSSRNSLSSSITIGNETFYPDRFYLNAPTGLSYLHARESPEMKKTAACLPHLPHPRRPPPSPPLNASPAKLCRCQVQQLFDRAKLIESLDLKAAIIGTYSLDRQTLTHEFPKLFDHEHSQKNRQVPTLILHGVKDLKRILRGERWVPGEDNVKEQEMQKEDEELRELFQLYQKHVQSQKDGHGDRNNFDIKEHVKNQESRKYKTKNEAKFPIEVIEIDDDDDDDKAGIGNNNIHENKVSHRKFAFKEHNKKDIAQLAKLHKLKLFRMPSQSSQKKSCIHSQPSSFRHRKENNNQQSSPPLSHKRRRTDNVMCQRRYHNFGEHVYFSKVQAQFLPPGKFHPRDIENYNPTTKGCADNIQNNENVIVIADSDSESGSDVEQERRVTHGSFGICSNVAACRQNMQGVYHPKYMILFEKSGSIVVVVSSANMTSQKSADASWMQRFYPSVSSSDNDSQHTPVRELRENCNGSDFGHVLADFLQKQSEAVKEGEILPIQFLRKYVGKFDTFEDFRKRWRFDCAQVHLVSTVPGYHPGRFATEHLALLPNGSRRILYGPQRVADILHRLCNSGKGSESNAQKEGSDKEQEYPKCWLPMNMLSDQDRLIIQTTSFGSKWTSRHLEELARQYMGHDDPHDDKKDGKSLIDKVDIIWPSMTCLEMISKMNKEKSPKDKDFHHFVFLRSEGFNSSDLAVCSQMRLFEDCRPSPFPIPLTPHIKTYARLLHDPSHSSNGECHRLAWVMLSSACFSRGAQGYSLKDNKKVLKSEDKRAFSNFELGILFVSRLEGNPNTDRIYVSYPAPCRCSHNSSMGDGTSFFANVKEIPMPFPFRLKSKPYQLDQEDATFSETPFFEKMTRASISSGFCSLTPFGQWCSARFSSTS